MIVYFDTSAFLPLMLDEPTQSACRELWHTADAVCTAQLLYVEAAAGLAQAHRLGRFDDESTYRMALRRLDQLWVDFDVLDVDDLLVRRAAEVARHYALRGYDAVHCAAAEQVAQDDLLVASGDRKLLDACRSLRLATADVHDLG